MIIQNYKNELHKLSVRKKYIVFLIIGLIICFFKVGISWVISTLSKGTLYISASNISMTMLPFFAELYIPLISFMAITDLFCTEFHDDTIKFVLLQPISRWKIITSKLAAAATVCVVYYLCVWTFCTVLEFIFGVPSVSRIAMSFISYVLDIIPLIVLMLMVILINMTTRSATLSMFLSIIIYALLKLIYTFGNAFGSFFFVSYMQWHKLWVGITLPIPSLLMKTGIIAGWAIILYTVCYLLFERKEF